MHPGDTGIRVTDVISATVHYELTGPSDAPVLVLAGPLGSSLQMWDPQVEALAGRFRVLRYDHRGHGRSAPAAKGTATIEQIADDLAEVLTTADMAAHRCRPGRTAWRT